ncbi:MAG TPA: SRPBCC family protein [Pyrinomonadaceae bacterium]|nr:SRPBCC family protein [Pyrinomonadaceae bacterium]
MNEPLTQQVIDGTDGVNRGENDGLLVKAAKHPFVTGGAILAGAGLAYAVVKTIQTAADKIAREVHIETSITIDKSPEELFAFWRDFKNLPLFMKNLESVVELDERKSHWVARGVGAARVEWDAEVYNEKANELIAWRSLENADVVNAGSVRFQKGPTGHGTYLRVTMNYNPPAGTLGASIAKLLGAGPAQLIKEDLRRLKQIMETGEIATIAGQTSGRSHTEEDEINLAAESDVEEFDQDKEATATHP